MANVSRGVRFACISNTPFQRTFERLPNALSGNTAPPPRNLSFHTGSVRRPEPASFASRRCSEKGCVFPAALPQSAKCSYHELQMQEPALFRSQQPSLLLLDPARCAAVDEEYDESRKRDRRRLAKQWEEFLKDSGV